MSIPNLDSLNRELLLAAQRTDVENVRALLAAGADPNAREPLYTATERAPRARDSERTPLMHAIGRNRAPEMIAVLLEAGADVHLINTRGWNALRMASGPNWSEVVRLLLEAGARARPDETPNFLYGAAGAGDAEMVQFALDAGYNPSGETGRGAPLENALRSVQNGHRFEPPEAVKCVELLLAAGAAADALGYGDEPLVVSAAKSLHFPILQALLRAGAPPDVRDAHQRTASLLVVGYSDAQRAAPMLQLLFEHGARFDVADKDSRPLLHVAAWGNDETGTMCRLVLDAGAPIESRDAQGETALMSAAKRGRSGAIRVLLEAGADIEARDDKGWTPLMHAVWIEPRMTHDANIVPPRTASNHSYIAYLRDDIKRFKAQRAGMRESAQILLDAGANLWARSNDGQSVLQLAASDPTDGVLELIANATAESERN